MSYFGEMREQNRLKKLPPEEREIVFYSEHSGYWPNFEGLVRELTDRGRVVSYVTSEEADPVLTDPPFRVRPFLIRDTLVHFMALLKCRVVVTTLTDLNRFHIKRSRHPVHYVYVFHSLVSTHMMYRAGAFDHYDSIFCVGPHQVDELRRHEERLRLKPKTLVEAGYYRLERIRACYLAQPASIATTQRRPLVLVAPSWGQDNVLETCGERLVELLLTHEFAVIVRPHPETVRRNPELVERLDRRFGNTPGFELERSVAADDSLLRADVLVCDLSGVALEYALGTERPVLFLDVPVKVQNPGYQELGIEPLELALRPQIGELLSPQRLEELPAMIERLVADRGSWTLRLSALREEYVFNFGRSSAIGADYILGRV